MGIERAGMLATMVVRSLLNNARISAWTLVTLATCAALVTLFTTTALEIGGKMSRELHRLGANAVAYPEAGRADWASFERVARREGAIAARLTVRAGLIHGAPIAVVGGDPQALQRLTPYWAVAGRRPSAANECLVGHRVADTLRLAIGQTIRADDAELRIVGIAESGDEDDDRVFVGAPSPWGGFTYALVSVAGGERGVARVQQALAAVRAGVRVAPLRQALHGEQQALSQINTLCAATLCAVLVLTALGVSASMLARVVERRKELALLQALGATRRAVMRFLLFENATVGVIAAAGGFVVGTLLAAGVVRQVFHASIGPQWPALAAALGTTTMVALLSGAIACGRALRFRPAAALRGE